MMASKSTIYPLTASFEDLEIPPMPLILSGIFVKGLLVANRGDHRGMLAFRGVAPDPVLGGEFSMAIEDVRDAMDAMDLGKVRFMLFGAVYVM